MQLFNRTPYETGMFVDVDRNGASVLALAVKATYDFVDGSIGGDEPKLAEVQRPLAYADVFTGKPGASSPLYESDANWGRKATDVAFVGYAFPSESQGRETDVALRVGSASRVARVFGQRRWTSRLAMTVLDDPRPFEQIPLIYENAFGGVDDTPTDKANVVIEARNPVGCGVRARGSLRAVESVRVPNIEDPDHLLREPGELRDPVGFGFVAKSWQPRLGFAGTYGDQWLSNRMPLLPTDFDPRFYQAGSAGLIVTPFLRGGEPVSLQHLTPAREARFSLPCASIVGAFAVDAAITAVQMNLDVLLIDAVRGKLVMVWHGAHPINGLIDDISWVMVESKTA